MLTQDIDAENLHPPKKVLRNKEIHGRPKSACGDGNFEVGKGKVKIQLKIHLMNFQVFLWRLPNHDCLKKIQAI